MPIGEPLVLRDEGLQQFREILETWISRWEERDKRWDQSIFYGPHQFLCFETKIDERQLRRIRNGIDQVMYSQADKILMAIGLHSMLDTGQISVEKSRHWTEEAFNQWMKEKS